MKRRGSAAVRILVVLAVAAPCVASASAADLAPGVVLGADPRASGTLYTQAEIRTYLRAVARARDDAHWIRFGLSTDGRPLEGILIALGAAPGSAPPADDPALPFVLVTAGIHPHEVASTVSSLAIVAALLGGDGDAARIRRDCRVLVVPSLNPDGNDEVVAWLRPRGASAGRIPFLSHRYSGHDLNRDWLLSTQAEVDAIVRHVHNRHRPWVTIDLHQMGSRGPRLFLPPYAAPADPALRPELVLLTDRLGERVRDILEGRDIEGIATRWRYDVWSAARAYPLYHGGLRFLVEVASAHYAWDTIVPPWGLLPGGAAAGVPGEPSLSWYRMPWGGGRWTLGDAVDSFAGAALVTLAVVAGEEFRGSFLAQRATAAQHRQAVVLDAARADASLAEELVAALRTAACEVARLDSGRWLITDPAGGSGWVRSLLMCTPYPAEVAGRAPYDARSHDLARLCGLSARLATLGERELAAHPAAARKSEHAGDEPETIPAGVAAGAAAAAWILEPTRLTVVRQLADLIEAEIAVEWIVQDVAAPEGDAGVRAGSLRLLGLPGPWRARLARTGCVLRAEETLGEEVRRGLRAACRPLRYPDLVVLRGEPASEEGWIRWLLEHHGFRFRALTLDELGAVAPAALRDLVVVASDAAGPLDSRADAVAALARTVALGGRVVACGGAAGALARAAELPLRVLPAVSPFLEGVVVPTSPPADPARRSSLLWGYERGPALFWEREGPVWDTRATAASVCFPLLLEAAPEEACGLVSRAEREALGRGAAVAVVRAGSGGVWILCGAPIASRGWNMDAFRLLFNALLAPHDTAAGRADD